MKIAAPSEIVKAIEETGRDAILRGSGGSDGMFVFYVVFEWEFGFQFHFMVDVLRSLSEICIGAAVCILETHDTTVSDKVRGLVRMVQVSPTLTLVDLTIRGLQEGTYWATVREAGDISNGAISTAGLWKGGSEDTPRGTFGTVSVGKNGMGSVFLDKPIQIWEMIGRGMVVSKQHEGDRKFEKNDENTLVGVIARSAGVWDNDKTVCSCSGKTLWEERKDEVSKGML